MAKIVITVTNDIIYDQRMLKIAKSLDRFGHAVSIIGRRKSDDYEMTLDGIKTYRLGCLWNKGVLFYLEYNLRLWWFCRKIEYDWHYSVDVDTLFAALLLRKRAKLAYDAHEYYDKTPELIGRPIKQFIWRQLEALMAPKAEVAITVNESLAGIFEQKYKRYYHVIRNVPYHRVQSNSMIHSGLKILLYQGALNKGRGLECCIKAMDRLDDDFSLVICGTGDIEQELKDLTARLGLSKRIQFLGNLIPDKLREVTDRAWLGLNLLDGQSESYYYSLANKFFDYMQAGVPSINMDFPEYRAILGIYDCGILLEKLDSIELASKVSQLAQDPNTYSRMSMQCLSAADEFNWENEEKKLQTLFY